MDARVLLERWDRAGIFDSDSSSGEDEDDNDQTHSRNAFLALDPVKEKRRRLENSYAYQNVRQRAAASLIKRNVLNWVRSKPSFCERVAEIEAFGRTTEGLLKELSLTSAALAGDKASGNTDIFAITTGRYDPKSRYNGSIAFKDLLQFSKHMALFPIDQALRTVEDVTRRRYLFDTRCAMKIQFVWRREVIKELEVVPTPEDEPAPPITPPQTVNNWESWSDEETEIENNEDQDPDDEIDQCVNFKREVVMRKGTMNYSPVTGPPDENSVVLTSPGKGEMKVWRRSTVAATQGLTAPHPPVNRRGTPRKKRPQGSGRTVLDSDPVDVQATPVRASTKQADARSELPLLLRRSRAAARRREKERIEIPEDELQDEVDDCDQNSNKQMWKRGGELPALALAQIRDRVGYKPKPFNQRRRSVVVEIPPAAPDTGSEEGESADDHPETIEEESDEDDETNSDEDSTSDHEGTGAEDDDDESSAADGDIGRDDPPRSSIRQRRESTELSKEFRRLHLASQERELSLQNSLLSQLHSEKSADPRRQSKQRRSSVHRRQSRRPSAQAQSEQSAISSDAVIPSYDPVLHDSSDEDWEPVRRRRVRVKTRDAAADANADLSGEEDNDDNDNRSFLDVKAIMTPAERDAAFQKLLTQYLGLLQCSPAEVARRLNVN
ncbi:hypothetical protein PHYBOEH_005638 [Phytophthora boehmeriae]|uniref:Uncharacterized protein n=1 Tax=Phytophthora boehmeriae TaxID=109152 RepID=A0A8T1WLG0_9STRA|nr:hypothetical protein PHYBOEH_005638 [Phytophthora boehmeriae]